MNGLELAKTMLVFTVLAAVAVRAWRSRNDGGQPRLLVRVVVAAVIMSIAFAPVLALEEVPRGWDQVTLTAAVALVILPPGFALLLSIIELITWPMRPIRSGKWLAASICLFFLIMLILPALLLVSIGGGEVEVAQGAGDVSEDPSGGWIVLQLLVILLAGAMSWWSCLPSKRLRLDKVFE